MAKEKLTPRNENYSEWYNDLVKQAELAENSSVRGCMIIKPYGYAIWENMKDILDTMFKNTGHSNAYFPLFIPKSFLSKEANHVEGFAKECAVVTHYRLKNDPDGKGVVVDPEAKLEEELIVRPTSETIIWDSYKKWINSYRDLPLLINQWANVVRWEMRTRIFLRTAEFLRQEGHTAHASKEDAQKEAKKMHNVYNDFARNFLAISPVLGNKPDHERFAGADTTYTLEPMMQDFKALQAGTSHFLGQSFGKAFDVTFTNQDNESEHVWGTSWGVSTRMMGGLIMAHSDDQGLVLPPLLAPLHLVIVPIFKSEEDLADIKAFLAPLLDQLENIKLPITTEYFSTEKKLNYKIDDDTQKSPGWKFNEYELKGVPLRITIGKRDMENRKIEVYNRITGEKSFLSLEALAENIIPLLQKGQAMLLANNEKFREENTYYVDSYEEFKEKIEKGFVMAHWDYTTATAEKIQTETKATIRCIPDSKFLTDTDEGKCMITGKPSRQRVLFAKAY